MPRWGNPVLLPELAQFVPADPVSEEGLVDARRAWLSAVQNWFAHGQSGHGRVPGCRRWELGRGGDR